jgi:hypothetical protein
LRYAAWAYIALLFQCCCCCWTTGTYKASVLIFLLLLHIQRLLSIIRVYCICGSKNYPFDQMTLTECLLFHVQADVLNKIATYYLCYHALRMRVSSFSVHLHDCLSFHTAQEAALDQ